MTHTTECATYAMKIDANRRQDATMGTHDMPIRLAMILAANCARIPSGKKSTQYSVNYYKTILLDSAILTS